MERSGSKGRQAFTLIELVIVIAIIGILAAIAIPRFADLRNQADQAAEQGTVGGVRSGILLVTAQNIADGISPARPARLESEAFSASYNCAATGTDATGCFDIVLDPSIEASAWERIASLQYRHTRISGSNTTFTYNATNGRFSQP